VAQLRRLLLAARAYPAVTVAAFVVLFGSAAATAAIVVATDDDETGTPTTTTVPTTSTTAVPTTTAAPTTTTVAPTTTTAAPTTTTAAPTTTTRPQGQRCLVRLHGKGGGEQPSYTDQDVRVITPRGNENGWGGRQWVYFPNGKYNQAREIVADALDDEGCDTVIINGFSNGGAFAAKLYCRGETFDGRVIRYVVDDPVVDQGVLDCSPADSTDVTLYWTGALDYAEAGWSCKDDDWTCEGGETIGIDAYAGAMGTPAKDSIYGDHQWYQTAPELSQW
jgi:hypothetical protein